MLGALITWIGLAGAQEAPEVEWEPIALVRPRFRSGYTEGLALGQHEDQAVTHRARLGLHMTRETIQTRVVAQLASGWERGPRNYGFVEPEVDFYEGWGRATAELPAKVHLALTAGRIPVTIHDGRLVSEDDFRRGQFVDGLHLEWGIGSFHWNTLTYRFPDRLPDRVRGATASWIGFSKRGPVTDWVTDFVLVSDYLDQDFRGTFGPHVRLDTGRFHLQTDLYVQAVANDEAAEDLVEASLLYSQTLGYTFGPERFLNVRLRGDLATPDLTSEGTGLGFAPPLGDSYRFFGHMGLFQSPAGSAGRGMSDVATLLRLTPDPRLELELDGHDFTFLEDGTNAGQEVDATARVHVSPYARVELGLFAYFPSQQAQSAFDTSNTLTQYVQFEFGAPPQL